MLKYRLKRLSRPKVIFWSAFVLLFFVSMSSIVRFYAADLSSHSSYGVSRIEGDTVIVNDLDADWYYYEGLNFTEITSRTVLPGEKRDVYNEDTLAMVQINYIGTDPNGNGWTGYVSKTERQSNFTYYKYYPIDENGYIEIELIDNPYTDRPKHPDYSTGTSEYRAFNGWICNEEESGEGVCDNLTFYHDYDYYVRTAKIKVDASKKVLLTLNASWTDAYVLSGTRSEENVQAIGMYAIPGFSRKEAVYGHPCNYKFKSGFDFYELKTASYNQEYSGYAVDFDMNVGEYSLKYVDKAACTENSCSYLVPKSTNEYVLGTYYFEKTGETEQSTELQWIKKNQVVDVDGNPVLDADGNPIYEGDIVDDGTLLYKEVDVHVEVPITLHKFFYTTYIHTGYVTKYYDYQLCEKTTYTSVTEKVGDAVVSDIFDYGSSLNWYYYKDSNYDTSKKNLYYNGSGQRCDMSGVTCNTTNGVYRLVQSWDDEIGTWKNRVYADENDVVRIENNTKVGNYYYLVTRDTNIMIHNTTVSSGNIDLQDNFNNSTDGTDKKPFTLTSDDPSAYVLYTSDSDQYWMPKTDIVLENLILRTGAGDSESDDTNYSIITNFTNLKISRTVKPYNSNKVARTIFIANGSKSNLNSRVIVEAGDYNQIYSAPTSNSYTFTKCNIQYILGSDYDRVSNIQTNLKVYHRFASGTRGTFTDNGLIPSSEVVVKSGTIGEQSDNTFGGIYIGQLLNGSSSALRLIKVEGGVIHHILGGLLVPSGQYDKNMIGIYVTGGKVTNIFGGAGETETGGNRIISVTGGVIRHAVAGGSNSSTGDDGDGPVHGDTLVYIGGNATIGDGTTPQSSYKLDEDGNVFGAGFGISSTSVVGAVDSSKVIVNLSNAGVINGSVYGGGNFGPAGGDTTAVTSSVINIYNGKIVGSVYGGANSNGAGKTSYANCHTEYCLRSNSSRYVYTYGGKVNRNAYYPRYSYRTNNTQVTNTTTRCTTSGGCDYYLRQGDYTDYYPNITYYYYSSGFKTLSPTKVLNSFNHDVTINMYGGNVNGSVYGGSKSTGYIYGDVDINLYGGKVTKSVYGGGYGKPTRIMGSVDIDTDTDGNSLLNIGNIYGGSALGVVNPGSVNTYTNIRVNGGMIGSVYGGGEGNTSTTPYTDGSIKVSVLSGKIGNVFGGTNVNGAVPYPNKTLKVYVTGGEITNVFGGGNGSRASTGNTYVGIAGGTISNVYGGGNEAVVNGSTDVDIGLLDVSIDTIDSSMSSILGAIIGNVYGGGNKAVVSTSTDVDIAKGNIQNAFGGGNEATVPTSNISITGGSIEVALYGGGNKAKVNTTTVDVSGGTFTQTTEKQGMGLGIFGGGANVADAGADNTTVNLKSGVSVYNVYGGSNVSGTITGTAKVNAEAANIGCNLYGGGYQAAINNSNVSITGSTTFSYTLNPNAGETAYNTTCGMAFGGGASANVNGTANITLDTTGKAVALYGGSNKAGNVAKTNVIVKRGVVSAVFGGNNYDGATGEASVTINQEAGKLTLDNVYGGSNGQNAIIGYEDGNGVYELGSTNVLFTAGTIKENIFGGGNEAPVFGNTNVTMTAGTVNRVYGGGNKAFIGDFDTTNTKFEVDKDAEAGIVESFVNISGGRVKNNVYGSGNASFVDGNTRVNLASSSTTAATTKTLRIDGSVFGGSETNADEDKTYQYKAIGVSGDATITVDGTGYFDEDGLSTVKINGSIYGGGNNSNTRGNAKLYVDKVGVKSTPMSMASIQRFSNVYIKDSVLELNGARDRSLQTRYTYGFVRIDNLYLLGTTTNASTLNGSTLYMARGNILVKKYFSGAMSDDYKSFVAQTTTENADGSLSNGYSDNKLYMYENIVFAVSTKEDVLYDATAGTVRGMTFLGMYNHGVDGDGLVTGVYDTAFKEGEKVGNLAYSQITSDAYTYAYGFHEFDPDYQIVTHGFYTNKVGTDQIVDVDYVGVTPLNLYYYKWVIGKERQQILVDLEASKNSTRESQNVKITLDQLKEQIGEHTFEWRDASMLINSVDTSTFKAAKDDVTIEFDTVLVDKTDIDAVNVNDDNGDGVVDANNYFALSMGTTSEGWLDNFKTNFYENGYSTEGDFCTDGSIGDCVGNAKYVYDSTTLQRGLTFWLDHSKNLDFSISTATDRENSIISLGTVTIKTVFTNPHADPGSANQQVEVDIVITITMTDSTRDVYGAAIAPGFKTKVFSSANTSIPTNGVFSIYQSLSLDLNQPMMKDETKMWEVDELYGQERTDEAGDHYSESYRYLASNYLFPKGTKITLLDLVRDEQYYYEVTKDNRNEVNNDANGSSEYRYMLENFIRMGSTSGDNKYDDDMNGANSTKYYTYADDGKIKFAVEEFVFNVDFSAVDAADMITEVKQFYLFMQLSYDKNGAETVLLSPDGDPTEGMAYILNPDITSKINSSGGFVEEGNDETVPTTEIYMGEDTDLKLYTTFVNQRADGTTATGVTNTTYENYKLGAKITIMKPSKDESGNVIVDSSGNVVYEQVTGDMFGTVFTINGQKYYPQIDGTTRLQLAGRISDVISDINIDFENSSLVHDDYKIVVETFASYDGLYYGDADVVKIELPFKLLNNQYGLNVTIPPVQITHDVNTGKDKNGSNIINYIVDTKNGVADPYLRISLQRRNYNSYFDTSYTDIDLKNIVETINVGSDATNILDICYPDNSDTCLIYTLTKMDTSKGTEQFEVNMTLKDGPTSDDLLDLSKSGWKSGTYRVVFTLYDGDVPVGSVYEYLIIRSLDIDEIIGIG